MGGVKTLFKLQDVNLWLNNFWSFFRIWNKVLPRNGNLTKTFLLGTFGTTTLGVNDLIHEPFQIWKKLQKLFSDKSMSCNLKIIFMSPIRVKSFFTFKDKLPKMLLSGLVYQYKCGGCNATYYGKTKHYFKVWICKHLGISHLTEKKVKIDNNKLTAIQEHLLCCNY